MAAKQAFDYELNEDFGGDAFFPASQETFTRAEIAPLLQQLRAAWGALREHKDRLDLTVESAEAGMWDWDVTDFRRAILDLQFTQTVVDRMNDAVYWADKDGRLVYVNEAACAMLGYTRDEFLSRRVHDLVENYSDARWLAHWEDLRQHGRLRFETCHRRRDGSSVPVEVQTQIVTVGDRTYACGIARDISHGKAMEAALRASDAKFASFFDSSPVAMSITRVDDGRFVAVNAAFEEATGYTQADVVGRTALELNLYADPADRAAMLAEVRRSGVARSQPLKFRTRDGALIECLISVNTVPVDGVECFLAGIINIQLQRDAEVALEARQADMLAMLENTDSLIWSIDRDFRLTAGNSAFRQGLHKCLGYDLPIGASVLQSRDREANARWRAWYERALQGEAFLVDAPHRDFDTSPWMEYRFSPVRDSGGEIVGATILGRDITERIQTAEQIEAQLAEISFYYDTAPVGLAVLDTDLHFLRINESLAAMNGVSVEDHIGKTVADVVPLLDDQARQLAETILSTGNPVTDIEIVGETPADPGVTHYWSEHWYPLKRGDGTIIGFNVTADDITERKMTREQLERSQRNLARAQEIGHLGNWEWDVPNRRLEWSDELYRIFGVDKSFVPSYAAIEALIHPDDRAYDNAVVQDALAGGNRAEFEIRIIRPDGEVRHIYEYIEIERDKSGAARMLFGVVQDITERKLVEVALRHRERTLNEAERIGQSGSWEYDLVTDRVLWSDNMYRIFDVEPGLPVDNFFERFHQTLIHPDDRERIQQLYDEAIADGQTYDVEYRVIRRDGNIRHVHSIAAIIRDEAGQALQLLGWVQDITEQKLAAAERDQLQAQLAQAQKMETVGRLVGGIAHDFNNLLAAILLRSELALQMVPLDSSLYRSLSEIYTTGQRSAALVQQLLGYARKQTIMPKVIDLNAAVGGMLPMLSRLIGEEIDLVWEPCSELWPLKMDAAQIDQIVTNLCVNARDAIDGVGVITVKTANAMLAGIETGTETPAEPGDYVLLSVSDTGIGMEPEVLGHIFEPFYTTKGLGKGVGLGLATVDGIVQQNGGRIEVTSALGVGTTFTIYLPRHATPVDAPAPQSPLLPIQGVGGTVLLVEDEAAVLDMAAEVLRTFGYTVMAAQSPNRALYLAEQHAGSIDLLLTDVIMPEMNGANLAALVGQQRPKIKTIFMSGYPADHVAHRGVLADNAHFLAKPFTLQTLAAKVRDVLSATTE